MSVTTQSGTLATLPPGTVVSTVQGDGGVVQVMQPSANATTVVTFTASDVVVGAPDGQGTLLSGASTPGSVVAIQMPGGFTAWTLLVDGLAGGTVYTEASLNSTNGTDGKWVEVKGRRTGVAPGVEAVNYAITSSGIYRGNGAGFTWVRARLIGATVFPTLTYTLSEAQGATFLNSGIPGGTSTIGNVGITNAGQALAGASVPVVLALDQQTMDSHLHRELMEANTLRTMDQAAQLLRGRATERFTLADRRGRYDRGTSR